MHVYKRRYLIAILFATAEISSTILFPTFNPIAILLGKFYNQSNEVVNLGK